MALACSANGRLARAVMQQRLQQLPSLLCVSGCTRFPYRNCRRGIPISSSISSTSCSRGRSSTRTRSRSRAGDAEFSLRQLRDLALLCGRNTAGTKPVLRAELQTALQTAQQATTGAIAGDDPTGCRRILSVDMGVRNLAYCLLQVGQGEAVPKLLAWERLSLIDDDDDDDDAGKSDADEHASVAPSSPSPCPYSPPAMAAVAARLVRDRLLPLAPSHVLIERQRFRSAGAAAVFEWTVRVNSLEAMLHGILAARQLAEVDAGSKENSIESVQAVSPRRVAQFVVRGGLAGKLPPSLLDVKDAKDTKDIKDVKEALVASILRPPDAGESSRLLTYDADGHVGEMAAAFLARWDAKQKRKTGSSSTGSSKSKKKKKTTTSAELGPKIKLSKIDDLADCIAQGLVWLEWNQNTKALGEKGANFLLDTNRLQE